MNVMAWHSSGRLTLMRRPAGPEFAAPAVTGGRTDEDLMTRRQVASLFGVTSAAVATWARRGRLPEIRNEDGRPRYRRADVEALARGSAAGRRDDRAPESRQEPVTGAVPSTAAGDPARPGSVGHCPRPRTGDIADRSSPR